MLVINFSLVTLHCVQEVANVNVFKRLTGEHQMLQASAGTKVIAFPPHLWCYLFSGLLSFLGFCCFSPVICLPRKNMIFHIPTNKKGGNLYERLYLLLKCLDHSECNPAAGAPATSCKIEYLFYTIHHWPFPPFWGIADNTKKATKTMGFYSILLAMTRDPTEFGWHCWSNTAHQKQKNYWDPH